MKLHYLLATAVFGEVEERRFTEKWFIKGPMPNNWYDHPPQSRLQWATSKVKVGNKKNIFDQYFTIMKKDGAKRRENNVEGRLLGFLKKVKAESQPCLNPSQTTGRKRRSTSAIEDRTTWTGDAGADLEQWFLNIARYLKYEMFDKGGDLPGECKFEGLRLIHELERHRHVTLWRYCHSIDNTNAVCDDHYWCDEDKKQSYFRDAAKAAEDGTKIGKPDRGACNKGSTAKLFPRSWWPGMRGKKPNITEKQKQNRKTNNRNWIWKKFGDFDDEEGYKVALSKLPK